MALVEGRQILDAIWTTSEALDEWNSVGKRRGLLKLDLEQAYVKIGWAFLNVALKLKGFYKRKKCMEVPLFNQFLYHH